MFSASSRRPLITVLAGISCLVSLNGCQGRYLLQNNISGAGRVSSDELAAKVGEVAAEEDGDAISVKGGRLLFSEAPGKFPVLCSELKKKCDKQSSPSFCFVDEISGVRLNDHARLFAHGKSECEARRAVIEIACNRGIDLKSLDAISCGADNSDGKCPVDSGICVTLYEPARCVAKKYAGDLLATDSFVAGWGANTCVARMEMGRFACSRNLNPEKLGDVKCERMVSFQGDCPPVQPACDLGDKTPTNCEASFNGEVGKLTSSAASACLARYKIEWQLCLAGQSPAASINSIKCTQRR
jgi:hypothetical protein